MAGNRGAGGKFKKKITAEQEIFPDWLLFAGRKIKLPLAIPFHL